MYEEELWLGRPPEISEEMIDQEVHGDVIVVGGGLAGVAAVRTITEMGASVILFEKCKGVQARSGDFAVMDSRAAAKWGRDNIDKTAIVNDLMRDMSYKVSQNILNRWVEEAGQAFDWYLEGYPDIFIAPDTVTPPPESARVWLQPRRLPLPEGYQPGRERYKCHQVTAWIRPSHIPVCRGNYRMAEETGLVTSFFAAPVVRLLRDQQSGRVNGVIARSGSDRYIRASAAKSVILATGDYMSDSGMLARFLPGMVQTPRQWTSFDAKKMPSNTGDGHKMGLWIGAKMQDAPHAPCAHHMGSVFGVSDFLLINSRGQRFVNEDAPGQQLGSQIENLPDKTAWQLVDSNWPEQIPRGYPNHGSVCYAVEDNALTDGSYYQKLCFIDNYIAPKYVAAAVDSGRLLKAETVEALVELIGIPQETALETIKRYNSLCAKGCDEDFGKRPDRLFPVRQGPFYAARFTPAVMIAAMGGLQSDEESHCYDTDGNIIAGLYLAGNIQGNRIAVDYPLTVPGLSHSLALTYGRIAGRNAVLQK